LSKAWVYLASAKGLIKMSLGGHILSLLLYCRGDIFLSLLLERGRGVATYYCSAYLSSCVAHVNNAADKT